MSLWKWTTANALKPLAIGWWCWMFLRKCYDKIILRYFETCSSFIEVTFVTYFESENRKDFDSQLKKSVAQNVTHTHTHKQKNYKNIILNYKCNINNWTCYGPWSEISHIKFNSKCNLYGNIFANTAKG